jgi:hypothetical protein
MNQKPSPRKGFKGDPRHNKTNPPFNIQDFLLYLRDSYKLDRVSTRASFQNRQLSLNIQDKDRADARDPFRSAS